MEDVVSREKGICPKVGWKAMHPTYHRTCSLNAESIAAMTAHHTDLFWHNFPWDICDRGLALLLLVCALSRELPASGRTTWTAGRLCYPFSSFYISSGRPANTSPSLLNREIPEPRPKSNRPQARAGSKGPAPQILPVRKA